MLVTDRSRGGHAISVVGGSIARGGRGQAHGIGEPTGVSGSVLSALTVIDRGVEGGMARRLFPVSVDPLVRISSLGEPFSRGTVRCGHHVRRRVGCGVVAVSVSRRDRFRGTRVVL